MTMTEIVTLIGFLTVSIILGLNIIIDKITHRLLARDPVKGRDFARLHKVREVIRKDGSVWWESFPFKDIVTPAPPSEAIEIMPGGKKYAEAYVISRDQMMWITDTGITGTKGKELLHTLEPFTTTDRSTLVQEFSQSEAEKGKNILSPEFIMPLASLMILGMIVVGALIFAPDVYKSMQETQRLNNEHARVNLEITQVQARITEALGVKTGVSSTATVRGQTGTSTTISNTEQPPA